MYTYSQKIKFNSIFKSLLHYSIFTKTIKWIRKQSGFRKIYMFEVSEISKNLSL